MNVVLATALFLAGKCASSQERQSVGFELVGPPETAALERALDRRLAIYAWGMWPRPERLQGALRGGELPRQYVSRVQKWLPRIVKKEFLPERIDPNQFYGIPRLRGGHNFIIGELRQPGQEPTIQFQAEGLGMEIVAISPTYFPEGVEGISDASLLKVITSLINYPQDKVENITIERHFEAMGDADKKVGVCYGKLRARGYDETKPSVKHKPGGEVQNWHAWWSYLPFWVTEGKVFINVTMVEWETSPASMDPYVFKFGGAK